MNTNLTKQRWLEIAEKFEITHYTECELHDQYDDMLDECCEQIKIGSLTYSPSEVLKSVDPIAYRCGFNDYLDGRDDIIEMFGEYVDKRETESILSDLELMGDS